MHIITQMTKTVLPNKSPCKNFMGIHINNGWARLFINILINPWIENMAVTEIVIQTVLMCSVGQKQVYRLYGKWYSNK